MARKQRMKVYHGIPKNLIDEHTIFYADFDGTTKPTIGNLNDSAYLNNLKFTSMPTGLGIQLNTASSASYIRYKVKDFGDIFTCDFVVNLKTNSATNIDVVGFNNIATRCGICLFVSTDNALKIYAQDVQGQSTTQTITSDYAKNTPLYMRLVRNYNKVRLYINGVLKGSITLDSKFNSNVYDSVMIGALGVRNHVTSIADLLVADTDKGDYFPNLPQDFIERKAVIRHRMGQQHIKGDPMYSQVTTLKVDTDPKGTMYKGGVEQGGLQRHTYKPELSLTSSNFPKGTSIKIKALNGEIISGIIDSDTALCVITSHAISSQQWSVDDVSKLKVGDTIVCTTPDLAHISPVGSIAEINVSTKTIKLSSPLSGYEALKGYYIFETTALTSSPAVKTQGGTNVVGTWSGLGTKEATFVLGDNANLRGQDLYIEYSLTMPCGNSDFPELPHTIERAWGENGIEMKPVSEIAITDDFKGKTSGVTTQCPHISRTIRKSSLMSNLTTEGAELNYIDYGRISNIDDLPINYVMTKVAGEIPQQLFSFNLVEIVERKMGCEIPSTNKAQWLRDNLTKTSFDIWGYGVHSGGNKFSVSVYLPTENGWFTPWYHTANSITKIPAGTNSVYTPKCIDDSGFVHYIAYTEASDGAAYSTIHIDYVHIEVKLKMDSAYVVLYGENTRSRESKCNPVLIQKETKTVKRYLPSKECFVTESTRLSYKDVAKAETGEIVSLLPYKIVTTNGTAKLTRDDAGINNYTDKIFLPSGYKPADFNSSPIQVSETDSAVSHTVQLPIIRYWGGKRYHGVGTLASGLDSCQTITTKTDKEGVRQYEIYAGLKNVQGQLVLVLRTDIRLPNNSTTPSAYTNRDYTLPNRPLIK